MLDRSSEEWVPSNVLSPPRCEDAVTGPASLVTRVSPTGFSMVPLSSRSGPLGWLLRMVMRVASTPNRIAKVGFDDPLGALRVTVGVALRLIGSMSSMTSRRADWLRMVTDDQLMLKVKVPQ